MKAFLVTLVICLAGISLTAQSVESVTYNKKYRPDYIYPIRRDTLQMNGNYELSLQKWLADTNTSKNTARYYQLAVNYATLGNQDSAFYYLNKYVDISADDRDIIIDYAFDELRENQVKWKSLIDRIETLYLAKTPEITNKEFAIELFYLDIINRKHVSYCMLDPKDTFYTAEKMTEDFNTIRKRWLELLDKYGFPTKAEVGVFGEKTAYYIVKHQYISNKYYRHIKEQFQAGNCSALTHAVVTDRYLYRKGKKQIYGSYLYSIHTKKNEISDHSPVLYPVKDFSNVNERRRNAGFADTVEEYTKKNSAYIPMKYYSKDTNKK